ncbi:dTMP kinase, partial [Streptomyces sp. TRM76130]|nr:dTMP kinase [Streptomyces sp. TRM76130]
EDTTVLRPVRDGSGGGAADRSSAGAREERVSLFKEEDTPGASPVSEAEVTAELPVPQAQQASPATEASPGEAEETAVLPSVASGAADETAVLPQVRGDAPADRLPPGYFRDEERSA